MKIFKASSTSIVRGSWWGEDHDIAGEGNLNDDRREAIEERLITDRSVAKLLSEPTNHVKGSGLSSHSVTDENGEEGGLQQYVEELNHSTEETVNLTTAKNQ